MRFDIRVFTLSGESWLSLDHPHGGHALPGESIANALIRCSRGKGWADYPRTQKFRLSALDEAGYELAVIVTTAQKLLTG